MIANSDFKPVWWLPGPHLQTLWPVLFRRRPVLEMRQERVTLADGDFLDLAWIGNNPGPPVLVMHGLQGSIRSHYAGGLLEALDAAGFRPLFMHFRGCSGTPNRLPRSYHSGETGDLSQVLAHIESKAGVAVRAAIGCSLGGNVLLKWLGEQGESSSLETAVAVSVPLNLNDCALRLETGASKLYRDYLLRHLRAAYKRKFSQIPSPLTVDVDRLRSFHAFDDQVTAPLHDFEGVAHYYATSSSRQFLRRIATPTLILQAQDDPFMGPDTIPGEQELSPAVTLELSVHGGHLGFIQSTRSGASRYWLDERIVEHLRDTLMPE